MAKVKIQGHASGTGVLTITAPNTSTDRTVTLPDSTGTLLDTTSGLDATKLSGNLPAISGASLTGIAGRKNWIINGDFQVSQRAAYTSATSLTSTSVYHLDRFKTKINTISGTLTHKLNQVVNGKTTNTMLLTATSAATGRVETVQQIEATAPFISQTITFSAWVKSDNTSARLIVHQNGANVQTSSNTHTGGGAFELLKGTVTCASNSGEIYLYSGIQAAGTGNVSVANNDYFEMAFVQLEYGSVATDFEHRSYGEELALCQRYYTTSFNTGVTHADNAHEGVVSAAMAYSAATATVSSMAFPVKMRTSPSLTIYGRNAGTGNYAIYKSQTWTATTTANNGTNESFISLYLQPSGAGMTAHYVYQTSGHYDADAEL